MIFTNRYFIAVGIPFLLILLGAIARKLIRSTGWEREDFFLGVDLSIASISSALIYISELVAARAASVGCPTEPCRVVLATADEKLATDAGFLVASLIAFPLVLAMHQDQVRNTGDSHKKTLVLGVVGNAMGVTMLTVFILLVKGIGR